MPLPTVFSLMLLPTAERFSPIHLIRHDLDVREAQNVGSDP